MDNQEAAQTQDQSVENTETLLNPQPESDINAPVEEAPIPLHDDSEAQTQEFTTDVDDEPIERPDYYPEKFWDEDGPDVEKLAKSYIELEKKFKSGDHKAPEGDYDVSDLVDKGLDSDDPAFQAFHDWSREYGISQSAFNDLAGRIMEISQSNQESMELDRESEMSRLGERAQEKIEMANRLLQKAPLSETERNAMADSINSADAINAFLKYHSAITNEGIPINSVVATAEMDRSDLATAIRDPRWQSDPTWRNKIEQQWMKANN